VEPIDQVQLSFDESTLTVLNVLIGLIMFGVALSLRPGDFKRIAKDPRGPVIGLISQFLLLPALSFLLILFLERFIDVPASVALGMILVAASPGGNFSNFLTAWARGNTAMSVSMTAVSTLLAIVMTPLNLAFWGSRMEGTKEILEEVSLEPVDMMLTIVLILVLPAGLGMTLRYVRPTIAERLQRPMQIFSLAAFFSFIAFALLGNWEVFTTYLGSFVGIVFLQNAAALLLGYGAARTARLPRYDARAISIETGIQNSALALVLVFNFFDGLGGMAVIAAWWGVWHLVSGLTVSTYWRHRPVQVPGSDSVATGGPG